MGRIQLSGSEIQIEPLALHSAFFLADALSATAFLGVTAASAAPLLFLFFFGLDWGTSSLGSPGYAVHGLDIKSEFTWRHLLIIT